MSHPLQAFLIELPADATYAAAKDLAKEVGATQGVDECGAGTTRAIDAGQLTLWVTLAGGAVTALGGAATVVQQVVDLCKRKGAKGARLVLSDGTSIPIENLSAQALLELAGKAGAPGAAG
jgi:hypothetical protein